jgi:carbonic anhydrase/acetyltransferase-like protein (isoleucine patch superfamily)
MIVPHRGRWPRIHETAWIAPSSDIVGDVEIGESSSVWFQCVIRGDVMPIRIGSRTNVQDLSMLHTTRGKPAPGEAAGGPGLVLGDEVTVGHRVMLHGCRIGSRVLIGMGAILMDQVEVGDECIIGAGSLVTQGTKIPPRSLAFGSPAKVVRPLTEAELAFLPKSAANYVGDIRGDYLSKVPGPARLGKHDADLEDMSGELEDDHEERSR